MSLTVDEIYGQAMQLPDEAKEVLAERLVAHLAAHLDPDLERQQLALAQERLGDIVSGRVEPRDGQTVMDQARRLLRK